MPNYVSFTDCGTLVGAPAKKAVWNNPKNTIDGVRSLLGRKFDDPVVTTIKSIASFTILKSAEGEPMIGVTNRRRTELFSPEEIAALLFARLKAAAEDDLKHRVTQAVVSCPSDWGDEQRSAIERAAGMAGLHVRQTLNERSAAAMWYTKNRADRESTDPILVYDLGESLEMSLLRIKDGEFLFHGAVTDDGIGAYGFESTLAQYCVGEIKKLHGCDLTDHNTLCPLLSVGCKAAKKSLSTERETEIQVEYLGLDFGVHITRLLFEKLNEENFAKCVKPIRDLLKRSGIEKSAVRCVLCLGDSTRIPKLERGIKKYFGSYSSDFLLRADHIIAEGTALQGEVIHKLNGAACTMYPIGDNYDGCLRTIIKRNTKLPTTITVERCTASDDQDGMFSALTQGDFVKTIDNVKLGEMSIKGLTAAPAGVTKVQYALNIDMWNQLKVFIGQKDSEIIKGTYTPETGLLPCVARLSTLPSKLLSVADDLQTLTRQTARHVVIAYCSVVEDLIERSSHNGLIEKEKLGDEVMKVRRLIHQIVLSNYGADYRQVHEELDRLCRPLLETLGNYKSLMTLRPNSVSQTHHCLESGGNDSEVDWGKQIIQQLDDECQSFSEGSASVVTHFERHK